MSSDPENPTRSDTITVATTETAHSGAGPVSPAAVSPAAGNVGRSSRTEPSLTELRAARAKLAALRTTALELGRWPETSRLAEVARRMADRVAATEVIVTVPCVLCRKAYAWSWIVDDPGTPRAVLCDVCDRNTSSAGASPPAPDLPGGGNGGGD